ncbi:hypothetical protein HHI36_014144 [Cryptolaemus montrouzieri]|uniref:Uncharacterized protein n=1 Tax=Cryptolaemus montrouzieri TaxID=559131 RepID=A0ABD2N1Z7_9CUCU
MQIRLPLIVFVIFASFTEQATIQKESNKNVAKNSSPIDDLIYMSNAFLRGDYIATLTKLVEMVKNKDVNLVVKIMLIFLHRFLTSMQPLYYILFPSTKDQGSLSRNFKTRLQTSMKMMQLFLKK